jgi:hypothetical protein
MRLRLLEAEGWSVWWDKSLGAADLYRDEIMKQLASARAVIAIWTPNSIRSDWVRAEAGTAKKEGKLIPVKTPDVAYADIPLPFGEMHTENLEASQLIGAAVVAQLAKPAVEPSALALLTKGFKYELLTWFGIIGGALTLFTNLNAVLKLADWARDLVKGWKEWTHAFWVWAFGWLGIHLSSEWTPVLSFLLFWSLLTIGQIIKVKSTIKNQQSVDIEPWSWRQALYFSLFLIGIIWLSWRFPAFFESFFEGFSIVGRGLSVTVIWSFAFPMLLGCFFMVRAGKVSVRREFLAALEDDPPAAVLLTNSQWPLPHGFDAADRWPEFAALLSSRYVLDRFKNENGIAWRLYLRRAPPA